jgi:hypothetical protein
MAAKNNPKSETVSKSHSMTMKLKSGQSEDAAMAEVAVNGAMGNSATIVNYSQGFFGELSLMDCVDALTSQIKEVQNGSLKTSETLLTSQAVALNAIFTELARRSALNMGEYLDASERYLRLALKAQNQCRATLETLAAIKNPPVVYAKQANINQGNGNQQVNNGIPSHAGKNINQQNELLEVQHGGETLDTRTTGAAIEKDKAMAAVD